MIFEGFDSGDTVQRIGVGRYAVSRRFCCLGETFTRTVRCANPAYACGVLDGWEAAKRKSMISKLEDRIRKP